MRGKSKQNPGGQKGRKVKRLEMAEIPDTIIIHDVTHCICCNKTLPKDLGSYKACQVIDLPAIRMQVIEHRVIKKTCTHCRRKSTGIFPEGIVQQAQYAAHLKALCVYLQNYQMLPFQRCSEFIFDLTGHQVSSQAYFSRIRL